MRACAPLVAVLLVGCCGSGSYQDLRMRRVTLPDGRRIAAEVMLTAEEKARGMMFRDQLPEDRGMLFIHEKPGRYPYWMYQVKVPLDILWMDAEKRVVELALDTPPCRSEAGLCATYGGNAVAQYVLELPGGAAARYGLRLGQTLTF